MNCFRSSRHQAMHSGNIPFLAPDIEQKRTYSRISRLMIALLLVVSGLSLLGMMFRNSSTHDPASRSGPLEHAGEITSRQFVYFNSTHRGERLPRVSPDSRTIPLSVWERKLAKLPFSKPSAEWQKISDLSISPAAARQINVNTSAINLLVSELATHISTTKLRLMGISVAQQLRYCFAPLPNLAHMVRYQSDAPGCNYRALVDDQGRFTDLFIEAGLAKKLRSRHSDDTTAGLRSGDVTRNQEGMIYQSALLPFEGMTPPRNPECYGGQPHRFLPSLCGAAPLWGPDGRAPVGWMWIQASKSSTDHNSGFPL